MNLIKNCKKNLKRAGLIFLVFLYCSCSGPNSYVYNEGPIYGTIYHIVYESPGGKDLQTDVEKKLNELDLIFSTFKPNSTISKINTNQPTELEAYFVNCFNTSQYISKLTDGAFDITVAPLVNAWGFGFKHKEKISVELIDSLLQFTGYQKVRLKGGKIIKENPKIMLDMSAISKGYTCDIIGDFLKAKGCINYMVEIGGEVTAVGKNSKGKPWSIGISKPDESALFANGDIQAIVQLPGHSLATSGNYRNFYEEDGKKYAHTIDPKTGYPVQHSLLSATVLSSNCMTADAFATAFMVLGLEKSVELAKKIPEIEVYFIYTDETGFNKVYMSEKFRKQLIDNQAEE